MESYKKPIWIIAFFAIVALTVVSCDMDSSTGSGDCEYKFVNESSYDITVSSAQTSIFKSFTVKSGKTKILKTNDWHIYFDYTNSDKVTAHTSGWGSSESRVVFRDR